LKQGTIVAELIPILSNAKNSAQFIKIEMHCNTAKVHFHHLLTSDFRDLNKDQYIHSVSYISSSQYVTAIA
jgi:hypothetical protein